MITIYHPEGSADVWGIKCKFLKVDEKKAELLLEQGWFKSPLDFDKPKTKPKKTKKAVKND
jgi:hypothetical protein